MDTLVFGARVVCTLSRNRTQLADFPKIIRNSSATLSGSISDASRSAPPSSESDAAGPSSSQPSRTASKADVSIYRSSRIASDVCVDRSGLILVALMSGGDYDQTGLVRCGAVISMALAKAGYGGYLVDGVKKHERSSEDLADFLDGWRDDVAHELETNESGWMKRKEKALAATVRGARDFPNLAIVRDYTDPKVSVGARLPKWDGFVDIQAIVGFVSRTFEWPVQEIVCKLRNNLWKGLAMREFRQKALAMNLHLPQQVSSGSSRTGSSKAAQLDLPSLSPASRLSKSLDLFQLASPTKSRPTPSKLLLAGIHDYKLSSSTDGVYAYRVELHPSPFLADLTPHLPFPDPFEIVDSPSEDDNASPSASPTKKRKPVKEAIGRGALSHWISAEFLKFAKGAAELIDEYEQKVAQRDRKKEAAAERKRSKEAGESPTKAKAPKGKGRVKRPPDAGAPPGPSQPNPSRNLDDDDVFKVPAIVRKTSAPSSKGRAAKPLARASSLHELEFDSDSDSGLPPSSLLGTSHLQKSPRKNLAQASPSKSRIKPKPTFVNIDDEEEDDGVPMVVAKETGVKKAGTKVAVGKAGGKKAAPKGERWTDVEVVDLCSSD